MSKESASQSIMDQQVENRNVFCSGFSGGILHVNEGVNNSENIYEEIESTVESKNQVNPLPQKPLHTKFIMLVALMATLVIIVIIIFSALTISLIIFKMKERGFQKVMDAYRLNASLSKENDLRMELEMLQNSCMPLQKCLSYDQIQNDIAKNGSMAVDSSYILKSCKMLPNSCPSGYYMILASNGSAIKVYCDMKKTCGNISGGWMRVTSLDMKESSAKCPSSLCLNTSAPRTCRRCYVKGKITFTSETYHVGVPYSKICGRLIAYQVGIPNGYSFVRSLGVDGVTLTYGNPEKNVWTFIAATGDRDKSACPCINPRNSRIPKLPATLSNHYFCDTASNEPSEQGKFYSQNQLWDGSGCQGKNQCCSMNTPPWFYRKLSISTTEPIVMKVSLNDPPMIEDLAIEMIDIYVQ